ncbi:flagellar hook capping FlgD N-terminal domain-containing protein [Caulobacter segnis]|uniref:flagellar hook assembly protein FlgD n=1 Tax=Caulobacter segnis TaxID=88688 RepID=UPI00240F592B|nr:flagellar hook capping FlgD N-terminal domain-containing protein [Caulobacter segnis]MDG2520876.1 flagellar hook capping FlgD N-terminal domain-containing protein [Caulobacter segnis]
MVDAVAANGTSIASRQANSRNTLAGSQETFLALLTTQLKNQDPLAPVDSTQFVTQTVQMVGVEQQLMTNDLLTALVGMNDGGLNESASMLGKMIIADGAQQSIGDTGKATWTYDLGADAKYSKLEIVDSAGKVVKTVEPEGDANKKGSHTYSWDGVLGQGEDGKPIYAKKGTSYTMRVKAMNATGGAVDATTNITGLATSVAIEGGQSVLTVNGKKVPMSSVIGMATPPAQTDTDADT